MNKELTLEELKSAYEFGKEIIAEDEPTLVYVYERVVQLADLIIAAYEKKEVK